MYVFMYVCNVMLWYGMLWYVMLWYVMVCMYVCMYMLHYCYKNSIWLNPNWLPNLSRFGPALPCVKEGANGGHGRHVKTYIG